MTQWQTGSNMTNGQSHDIQGSHMTHNTGIIPQQFGRMIWKNDAGQFKL